MKVWNLFSGQRVHELRGDGGQLLFAGAAQFCLGATHLFEQLAAVVAELVVMGGQGGADIADQAGAGLLMLIKPLLPVLGSGFRALVEPFGEGGKLAPDLTMTSRKDLDALLVNIVDPLLPERVAGGYILVVVWR